MKYFKLLLLLILTNAAFSQQIVYDKINQNLYATNPALVGSMNGLTMTAILGNQFNGTTRPSRVSQIFMIEKSVISKKFPNDSLKKLFYEKQELKAIEAERTESTPVNDNESNIPYENEQKYAFGLMGYSGQGSVQNATGISTAMSYKYPLTNGSKLIFGVQLGFNFIQILNVTGGRSQFLPNLGLGLVYQTPKYFVGLSSPLIFSKNDIYGIIPNKNNFLQFGTSLETGLLTVNPVAQVGVDLKGNTSYDVYFKAWYMKKYAIGAGISKSVIPVSFNIIGEYQLSKSTRLGFVFNPKPFGFSDSNGLRNTPILNFMLKFNLNPNDESFFSRF